MEVGRGGQRWAEADRGGEMRLYHDIPHNYQTFPTILMALYSLQKYLSNNV